MRTLIRLPIAALGCLLALAAIVPAAAMADLGQEEQQGRQIAEAVRAGERQCSDLSGDEFELVGEYAMGRYLGDTAAHEAMNDHMVAVMGEQGERRMHTALGHRYSGCRGGPAWGWMGPMAGMMFGGRRDRTSGYGPGMMGGDFDHGEMMGEDWSRAGHEETGFGGPWAAAMVGMMAVLIAVVVLGIFWLARHRRVPSNRRADPPGG